MATKVSAAKNGPASESPVAWYGAMTSLQTKTFWAAFGGWALNSLDFFIFMFALPAIVVALDMTRPQAMHIGTATLIASAIGGWVAGGGALRSVSFAEGMPEMSADKVRDAVLRRLIDLHNGSVRVQSTLGKGSTFYVYLPAVSQLGFERGVPQIARL